MPESLWLQCLLPYGTAALCRGPGCSLGSKADPPLTRLLAGGSVALSLHVAVGGTGMGRWHEDRNLLRPRLPCPRGPLGISGVQADAFVNYIMRPTKDIEQ